MLFTSCHVLNVIPFSARVQSLSKVDTGLQAVWASSHERWYVPEITLYPDDFATKHPELREAAQSLKFKLGEAVTASLGVSWPAREVIQNSVDAFVEGQVRAAVYLNDFTESYWEESKLEFFVSQKTREDLVLWLRNAVTSGGLWNDGAWSLRFIIEAIPEKFRYSVSIRRRAAFSAIDIRVASTREWVRNHTLWTGCPPPQDGSDQRSSVRLDGVAISVCPNFRPAHRPSATARHYCRPPARRCLQYRDESRSFVRLRRLARCKFYVSRRSRAPLWQHLEGSRGPPMVDALRMDRRLWCNQPEAA
jgi:hypothetical protein